MGKKGWWQQIQSGDYPETQTNYGQDLKALDGFRGDRPIADQNKETKKLQEKCPQCGKLYWVDKNICNNCGYTNNKRKLSKANQIKNNPRIYCNNCNHSKIITQDYLDHLKRYYSITDSIEKIINRFKCSRCGGKEVLFVRADK